MISIFKPRYPLVAFEVAGNALTMVRLAREKGSLMLEDFAVEPFEPGVVSVSMTQENIQKSMPFQAAIRRTVDRLAKNQNKISIVIPDNTSKISILDLESAPRNRKEMRELIFWQLKKVTPFPMDDGRIAYHRFDTRGSDSTVHRVLVAIVHRAVLEQIENMFVSAGLQPGLVDISTNNLYNLFSEKFANGVDGSTDKILLNCEDDGFTVAVLRGAVPILFRSKTAELLDDPTLGNIYDFDVVVREVRSSMIYYTERLKGPGLRKVLLRGTGFHILALRDSLEQSLDIPVELLDPGTVVGIRAGLTIEPGQLQRLAPALGAAAGR